MEVFENVQSSDTYCTHRYGYFSTIVPVIHFQSVVKNKFVQLYSGKDDKKIHSEMTSCKDDYCCILQQNVGKCILDNIWNSDLECNPGTSVSGGIFQ